MSIIKRTRNTDIECGVKGALVHCWWECELVQSLSIIENSIGFLKKFNRALPFNPAISLLDIHPKELKAETDRCPSMFIAPTYLSTHEQINSMWYIHRIL